MMNDFVISPCEDKVGFLSKQKCPMMQSALISSQIQMPESSDVSVPVLVSLFLTCSPFFFSMPEEYRGKSRLTYYGKRIRESEKKSTTPPLQGLSALPAGGETILF